MIDTILLNVTKMLTERKFLDEKNLEKNYKYLLNQKNDERIFKIKSDFSDKYFYILHLIPKITTIKKIQGLDAFLLVSKNQNRMFIAKNVTKKAYKQFMELNNSEVFFEYELLINLIDHELQPVFQVLNEENKKKYYESYDTKNSQMSNILTTDVISRYYNVKPGDIFRIIRPSNTSGMSFHYRLVVESSINTLFDK